MVKQSIWTPPMSLIPFDMIINDGWQSITDDKEYMMLALNYAQ